MYVFKLFIKLKTAVHYATIGSTYIDTDAAIQIGK